MTKKYLATLLALPVAAIVLATGLHACSKGGGSGYPIVQSRPFLMGSTPFFATPSAFPDWKFENLGDRDLLSLHVDDFLGVPWAEFLNGTPLPAAWVAKWTNLANEAHATGKALYLALSPLGDRKTLAPSVDASGNPVHGWAPVDANGCYQFATDANVADWKTAYINYAKYVIDLVQPDYFSPAIEMNIQFTSCVAADKTAWINWYTDVHNALKAAYPTLVIFPTFELEHMYGIVDEPTVCSANLTPAGCFALRLPEALAIPADRIAFSTYPITWFYRSEYNQSYPTDTFKTVQNATPRKIWISETGWSAVRILQSYQHGAAVCGLELFPASIANDDALKSYMTWLLQEAQTRRFEAVVWWLNRDYLDGAKAEQCPCPDASDTCVFCDAMYSIGGDSTEIAFRVFGNMGLRYYDGTARPAQKIWAGYLARPLRP